MRPVEDQTFTGQTLSVDNKHFIRCKIKDCVLVYSGEDFAFAETTIEGNLSFGLEPHAMRTVAFLKMFRVSLDKLGAPEPLNPSIVPMPPKKSMQ